MIRDKRSQVISNLINTNKYDLNSAIIFHFDNFYQIQVRDNHKIILDRKFSTLREAKESFHRTFQERAIKKTSFPIWYDYSPSQKWLHQKSKQFDQANRSHKNCLQPFVMANTNKLVGDDIEEVVTIKYQEAGQ